jgi:cytidylate kinase
MKKIVICVSGMAGSGKSTLAKKIAKRYTLDYRSGGDMLKEMAVREGYTPWKIGWWESRKGLEFLSKRSKNFKFDKEIDERLLEYANKGNVVLDSWTMPWLVDVQSLKIWLKASKQTRALRVKKRDKVNKKEDIIKILEEKERRTISIYRAKYGFVLGDDLDPFDLVINTDKYREEDIQKIVYKALDLYLQDLRSRPSQGR